VHLSLQLTSHDHDMVATTTKTLDLWARAVDSLDPQVIQRLHPAKTGVRDIVNTALRAAEAKREVSIKNRWRIKRRSKEDIIVRDVMEKIIHWIHRFKEVGDNAVQYDPGHAALPWAAVRFILQAAINYSEVEREMFEGIELVTRLLAKFRKIEDIYVGPDASAELQDALVSAYAKILENLAEAVKFLAESKKIRGLKAPFRLTGGENLSVLLVKEKELLRFTSLIDGQRLLSVANNVNRTAELAVIADKAVQEQEYVKILDWLSKTKYLDHHRSQRNLRSAGTGTWLLNHAEYISWYSKSWSSTLLVHGIPGCGKSILCSHVIDETTGSTLPMSNNAPVAFFYCSSAESEQDRRDTISVLRSLARQLMAAASRHPRIHSAALAAYDSKLAPAKQHGFDLLSPSTSECESLILAALEDNPATIVIDALDEIKDSSGLISSLELIRAKSTNVVKIFMTGRDSASVLQRMTSLQRIRITANENRMDVEKYILEGVDQLTTHHKMTPEMHKQVVQSLVSGAGETFQWAKLQLSQLQATEQPIVAQDLPTELARLASSTLAELYDKIFALLIGSRGTTRDLIVHAFAWLLYAQELFTVDAFLNLLAGAVNWETPSAEGLIHLCRGLIYVDTQTNTVRFVHESVRAYLRTQPQLEPYQAQTVISETCLRILKEPPADELMTLQPQQRSYDYATMYFGHHLSNLEPTRLTDEMLTSVDSFLFKNNHPTIYARIWLETANATFDSVPSTHPQKVAMEVITSEACSPLFPICAFAMSYVLQRHVWPNNYDWNQRNKHGHTALYVAVYHGHTSVVSFLLSEHADPNIVCGRLGTALQCAAYRGDVGIMQQLLRHGAEPNLPGKFPSVMHAACRGGQEGVVLALLDDPRYSISTQADYDSILSEVGRAGLAEALSALQNHPLATAPAISQIQQLATEVIVGGVVNGLRYLLRKSTVADVVLPGSLALSALHGHESMTAFLIDQGVDVQEQGDIGTPLRCASAYGHNNICRLLLDRGADVNHSRQFGSALHAAAMRGHLHTVKLLLDSGADVNNRGGYYGNALQAASYHGHTEVVSWLLAADADVHLQGFCKDAIEAARQGGRHNVVQLFEAAGYRSRDPLPFADSYACRPLPPPPDILRDSSPSRARESQNDAPVSGKLTKERAACDPFDPQGSITSPQDAPESRNDSGHDHSDHRSISPLWMTHFSRRRGFRGFTGSSQPLHDRVQMAVRQSAISGDFRKLKVLFESPRGFETSKSHYQNALRATIPAQPEVFLRLLQMIQNGLSPAEARTLFLVCLPSAAYAGWPQVVECMIEEVLPIAPGELQEAFDAACDAGNALLAATIHHANGLASIPAQRLVRCIKVAAFNGCVELLHLLLPMCEICLLNEHLRHLLCIAASHGQLSALTVLASLDCLQPVVLQDALNQSLNAAAYNVHSSICTYLIAQGADICAQCAELIHPNKHTEQPGPRSYHNFYLRGAYDVDLSTWGTESSKPHDSKERDEEVESDTASMSSSSDSQGRISTSKNAIEACMDTFGLYGDENTQLHTLEILLDSVTSFAGTQWDSTICKAAQCLPVELLELMALKGASGSAMVDNRCALSFAASRELHTRSAVNALLGSSTACKFEESSDLERPLRAALAMFEEHDWYSRSAGLFPQSKSLVDVFTSGPGAVVQYFLSRLPHEKASGKQYALLLEMAAAADQLEPVQLLIDHDVNVNAKGHYYGTALQAASRYGHRRMVETLLRAGADPNNLNGQYGTALRAAVISQNMSVVQTLLDFRADTELCENGPSDYYGGDDVSTGTALYLAMREKSSEIVQALVVAGADVNTTITREKQQQRPLLIMACTWGNIPVVRSLLHAGADVHVSCVDAEGYSSTGSVSAMHAAINEQHFDVVQLLLASGFKVDVDIGGHASPLEFAVQKGNHAVVDALLESLLPESTDALSKAIGVAIELSQSRLLERLLDHARTTILSSAILGHAISAYRVPDCKVVEVLLDELCIRGDLDMESEIATIDFREIRSENFETLLQYMPFTGDFFVEVCIRGDISIIRRGIKQGFRPSIEDRHGRPALHFAAAQGRVAVVKMLLDVEAATDYFHSVYGTPLVMALEGCSVKALLSSSLDESKNAHIQELADLESLNYRGMYSDDDPSLSFAIREPQILPYRRPKLYRGSRAEYLDTIDLLIARITGPYDAVGKCGSALSLAAFMGSSELFEALVTLGANVQATGEARASPFLAAVVGKQVEMVARIATTAKVSVLDPDNRALHLACESCDLPVIRLLHTYGYNCNMRDVSGQTPLNFRLVNLAKDSHNFWIPPGADAVIHTLLQTEPEAVVYAEDLTAACGIKYKKARNNLLRAFLRRSQLTAFPADGFAQLVRASADDSVRPGTLARQILDENGITALTNEILAAAHNTKTVATLLDYHPAYVIDSSSLDDVGRWHDDIEDEDTEEDYESQYSSDGERRESMDLLFRRNSHVIPSEANVRRALVVVEDQLSKFRRMEWEESEQPTTENLIDAMFKRNNNLTVTEEMLTTVLDAEDLKALLAHVEPGRQVITTPVFDALVTHDTKDSRGRIKRNRKRPRVAMEKLLRVFLDFDPSVTVPPKVSQHFLIFEKLCELDTLACLLRHDTSLRLSAEYVSSAIESIHKRGSDSHDAFVDILQDHREQWDSTDEFQQTVGRLFGDCKEDVRLSGLYSAFDGIESSQAESVGVGIGTELYCVNERTSLERAC
jgi:ankyrin repeat protein